MITRPPGRFLTLPFDHKLVEKVPLTVSQGWDYSDDEKTYHPQISTQYAVDFPLPWGTPIYSPANGYVVASYHLSDLTSPDGRVIGYGLGLFVQIWHPQAGVYTLYAHLSRVSPAIPYIGPEQDSDGSWQPRKAIYLPVAAFRSQAEPVTRGNLLGEIGYTGLRNGYPETPSNPTQVDPTRNKTWDPAGAHLHWEVYRRVPDGSVKDSQARFDPFGIYGLREQYAYVFKKAHGLILANPDGSPRFAR